ncbi:MAG: glycosyltransferase family 4 protein [Bdellovibrionota bacterium]
MQLYRILYLYPGPNPPPAKQEWDKHCYLSRIAEGDVLLPTWWMSDAEMEKHFPAERQACGNFRYHVYRYFRYRPPLRAFAQAAFYLSHGLRVHRSRKYQVIICYGSNVPGVCAVLLSLLTGAKLILEVPGVPDKAYRYESPDAPPPAGLKPKLTDAMLNLCIRRASRIRLLFPTQLKAYPAAAKKPVSVFHEFVPVTTFQRSAENDRYLLFVGYPWFLKGVDVLLRAFREIAGEVPDYTLKIVGWCTDRRPFEKLAEGLRVEFSPGVPFDETVRLMSRCSAFVLPSRTEAMGRVLLEAMALGKPVVASRVDGIPYYVDHGRTGLLFESENVSDLAVNLRRVLLEPELADRLGRAAADEVRSKFGEVQYVSQFQTMLEQTLGPTRSA